MVESEINQYQNGSLKERIRLNSTLPLLYPLEFPPFVPSAGYNTTLYKKEVDYLYETGSLVQVEKNGFYTSYIWGYNNSYPLAEVAGARRSQIFYTSFEENGLEGDAVTGKKYYSGSAYTIPVGERPENPGNLKMTYWFYDGAWKMQHEIPYTSTITAPAASRYDEVRVYPAGTLMTTYTYTPLIGMTTKNDVNNIRSFFEYDPLFRLATIRNNDHDIVKHYRYDYGTENTAKWTATGARRCKTCEVHTSYESAITQVEERDINPISLTYNQLRWQDRPDLTDCVDVGNWIYNSNQVCIKDSNGFPTRYRADEYRDVNPCSPTFNQTRLEDPVYHLDCAEPVWVSTGVEACAIDIDGHTTGVLMAQEKNMNPHSPTYLSFRVVPIEWTPECSLIQHYSLRAIQVPFQIECKTLVIRRTFDDEEPVQFKIRLTWDNLAGVHQEEIVTYDMISGIIDENTICKQVGSYFEAELLQIVSLSYNPQWLATGILNCIRNQSGQVTGYQEHEERDVNSLSPSYNQIRWINDGSSANCDPTPLWQNTGQINCLRDGRGLTTGQQQHQEKDINVNSVSYNQTRWIADGSSASCLNDPQAVWEATGEKSCIVVEGTLVGHRRERDINSHSTTYNQLRWAQDLSHQCSTSPIWQPTANTSCESDEYGITSGNILQQEKDVNPYSATYNQIRWTVGGFSQDCANAGPYGVEIRGTGDFHCQEVIIRRSPHCIYTRFQLRIQYDDLNTGSTEVQYMNLYIYGSEYSEVICEQSAGSSIEISLNGAFTN